MGEQLTCCQCGNPRSPLSGRRCRFCYRLNSLRKKLPGVEGAVFRELLNGERTGMFEQIPIDKWRLTPYFQKEFDRDQRKLEKAASRLRHITHALDKAEAASDGA